MIEEKDILALVQFKAQVDVDNGLTFLRCVDPVFGSLISNGTVATGLMKQQSKFVDGFKDTQDQALEISTNNISEPIRNLCYSKALMMVKKGYRICRENWNGENQWGRHVNPDAPHPDNFPNSNDTSLLNPYFKAAANNAMAEGTMVPFLAIKTTGNAFIPWLPTQTDNLAEDWVVLPK